jgi:hypothetical protein
MPLPSDLINQNWGRRGVGLVVHQNETAGSLSAKRPVLSAQNRVTRPQLNHVGALELSTIQWLSG